MPLANYFAQCLKRSRQETKQLLIDQHRIAIGKKNWFYATPNTSQCLSRFPLPHTRICLSRAITLPEEIVERCAVRTEHYRPLPHSLKQRAATDDLIIRMSHHHQRSPEQW